MLTIGIMAYWNDGTMVLGKRGKYMTVHITLKLFATLSRFTPASPDKYPIEPGATVRDLLKQLDVAEDDIKLIFIDGKKGGLTSSLHGGERVGIFPPVGGG